MRRIDTSTKAADLFGVGKHGFQNGNSLTGAAPTFMNAEWHNSLQEELATVVEYWIGALVPADNTQLKQAIIAAIAAGVTNKVNRAGDMMSGSLAIIAAALELTLRHTDNVAGNGAGHLLFQRGAGAGASGRIISYGDGANGLDKLSVRLDNAAGTPLSEFKFKSGGQLELGAAPTLALEAATKGYVDAAATPDASTAVKGKVQLLDAVGFATGVDVTKALTAGLFTKTLGSSGYITLPGGLIIQWGTSTGGGTITFPVTFPNALVNITSTYNAYISDNQNPLGVNARSVSGFTSQSYDQASTPIYWLAIGY